jgi:hypothetical protein
MDQALMRTPLALLALSFTALASAQPAAKDAESVDAIVQALYAAVTT